MHPWGHWPVKAAILLWSALHPEANRGGVMTWHYREKYRHHFVEVILVGTESKWGRREKVPIEGTWRGSRAEVEMWSWVVQKKRNIRHAWRTTGDSTLGVCVQQWVIMERVVVYVLLKRGQLPNGSLGEIRTLPYVGSHDQGRVIVNLCQMGG